MKALQVHVFFAASLLRVCASAYLRTAHIDGRDYLQALQRQKSAWQAIIQSSTLSPDRDLAQRQERQQVNQKYLPVPEIELLSMAMGVNLARSVEHELQEADQPRPEVFFWGDKASIKKWLLDVQDGSDEGTRSRRLPLLIHTRPDQWRQVPYTENPAELGAYGRWGVDLETSPLWQRGPEWLIKGQRQWPEPIDLAEDDYRTTAQDRLSRKLRAWSKSKEKKRNREMIPQLNDRRLSFADEWIEILKGKEQRLRKKRLKILNSTTMSAEKKNWLTKLNGVQMYEFRCKTIEYPDALHIIASQAPNISSIDKRRQSCS